MSADDDRARALALTPVSRETAERLDRFVALLRQWQDKINLIAPSTLPSLWVRHISDSLQLLPLAPRARRWVDLGAGGGFPGLVLAIAMAEHPDGQVDLVESNARKAAFLREAARVTGARASVHAVRIEDFVDRAPGRYEIVTARALAPLQILLGYAQPLLAPDGEALFLKGQDVASELTEATKSWNCEVALQPSLTDPRGRIVRIRALGRKSRVP